MWYDVRYRETTNTRYPTNETSIRLRWRKTPAVSKAEALEAFTTYTKKYGRQYSDSMQFEEALFACPLTNEWDTRDKSYWYDKWREAMAAMPVKIKQHKHESWEVVPKGHTPLPEFIEKRAKGQMQLAEGLVIEKFVHFTSHEYGRASALGILLGYITWTGADHKRKRANSCAMLGRKIPESSRPRDPKARELLSKLGTMPQDEIKAMLAEKRAKMNG